MTANPNTEVDLHHEDEEETTPTQATQAPKSLLLNKTMQTLGTGTTGRVFLAEGSNGVPVAVKMADKLSQNTQYSPSKELSHEIQVLSRLSHPHIVRYIGSEETETELLMQVEYLKYGDLESYIKAHGSLDHFTIKKLILQVVSALSYLQSQEISHHDIKLENIGIDEHFNAKLFDFAFAIDYSQSRDKQMRQYSGTPLFSAPEILERRPHNNCCDVFSLGVCLFYLLYGLYPFCSADSNVGILKHRMMAGEILFPDIATDAEKDLLKKMLCIYKRRRILLHQIPKHPFFQ